MERRGQERDIFAMQNPMTYNNNNNNPPQIIQESSLKLPLAPLVSPSADRKTNAILPTRRGSAIFSPTQILDHPTHPPPHLRRHPNPPPVDQKPISDPDPDAPISKTVSPSVPLQSAALPVGPPDSTTDNNSTDTSLRYGGCLRNHAASIGGHVLDGCGEFMASGEEGTPEAFICAACGCHRNFHRKDHSGRRSPLPSVPRQRSVHPGMVSFGGAPAESSSEELNVIQEASVSGSKKRFRTKFSQKQKDRMQEFAEKVEWRIQKQDEQELQRLCGEIGVRRQVFKVWMHNNKQAMKRKEI